MRRRFDSETSSHSNLHLPTLEQLINEIERLRKELKQARISRILNDPLNHRVTYQEVWKIYNYLVSAKSKLSEFTIQDVLQLKKTQLRFVTTREKLVHAMKIMEEMDFSQVPILTPSRSTCIGFLTELSIVQILQRYEIAKLEDLLIEHVTEYLEPAVEMECSDNLADAATQFNTSYAVLVVKSGVPTNVLSRFDILHWAIDHLIK